MKIEIRHVWNGVVLRVEPGDKSNLPTTRSARCKDSSLRAERRPVSLRQDRFGECPHLDSNQGPTDHECGSPKAAA